MKKLSNAQKLNRIFTPELIETLKANKDQITHDLLVKMRSFGNEGKRLALLVLDFEKDNEQYYIDAFGNRCSFDGNRRLKKQFTKFNLADIHKDEIKRCHKDIHYFKDNYIQIKTKTGVTFPEMRVYQNEFLGVLDEDNFESVIGLMGRQSGKSVTTGIFLSHCYTFKNDLNMGVVSNRAAQAKEFLNTTKNMLLNIPIWMQAGTVSWNKNSIESENVTRCMVDVPSADSFTGFTMDVVVVDECSRIKPNAWEDFADSIFPSQSGLAWKKNIIISTMRGLNHYYDLVKGAREKANGYEIYEVDWRVVPRYTSDGSLMAPEEFQRKIIEKHGLIYFEQNYANSAIGSSHTLINAKALTKMKKTEPEEIRDGKLNIYTYPKKGHKYMMSVDPCKDGIDNFSVQILDITSFQFEQVASASMQIEYLLMPEFLNEWCDLYNKPYLIIENNEGAGQSIADQMYQTYEYENLHFDKMPNGRKKKYPGFRTTTKTRRQILQTLKLFIDNGKLEVVDATTIDEFRRFILINNKYQADEGCHDDSVMALALAFVAFCNSKNFDDMKELVKNLYADIDSCEDAEASFIEYLTIGDFDDGSDEREYDTNSHFRESFEPEYYLSNL